MFISVVIGTIFLLFLLLLVGDQGHEEYIC